MKRCIGCGIELQYEEKEKLGYTESLENNICERCFKLKNYGVYKKVPYTNLDYEKILKNISNESLVLYITDILSLDCPNIENFKKVILVITKKDILPQSIKSEKIINYAKKIYPHLLAVFLISSKTGEGIETLYQAIKKESKKVYLVGSSNSGKSTLVNKLISLYGDKQQSQQITVSMYPSNTLNKIEINLKNITLIDTPGLINKNNITNYLTSKELKEITPKKEIKPKSCQIEGKGSIIIGSYIRIDYNTPKKNSIVIYISNNINIRFASLKNNQYYNYPKYEFSLEKGTDIVIPGLGFIKGVNELNVTLYTRDGIKPSLRKNLI